MNRPINPRQQIYSESSTLTNPTILLPRTKTLHILHRFQDSKLTLGSWKRWRFAKLGRSLSFQLGKTPCSRCMTFKGRFSAFWTWTTLSRWNGRFLRPRQIWFLRRLWRHWCTSKSWTKGSAPPDTLPMSIWPSLRSNISKYPKNQAFGSFNQQWSQTSWSLHQKIWRMKVWRKK